MECTAHRQDQLRLFNPTYNLCAKAAPPFTKIVREKERGRADKERTNARERESERNQTARVSVKEKRGRKEEEEGGKQKGEREQQDARELCRRTSTSNMNTRTDGIVADTYIQTQASALDESWET